MNIIKREDWGMLPPSNSYKSQKANKIIVHHNGAGSKPNIPDFKGKETIRAIERWHVEVNNWNALGYHFIIAPNGDIYQGRPIFVRGAHAGYKNNINSIGIMLYGNFDYENPTTEQIKALKELIVHLNIYDIYGHKDVRNTTCPGKNLYKIIKSEEFTYLNINRNDDNITKPLNDNVKLINETIKNLKSVLEILENALPK